MRCETSVEMVVRSIFLKQGNEGGDHFGSIRKVLQ